MNKNELRIIFKNTLLDILNYYRLETLEYIKAELNILLKFSHDSYIIDGCERIAIFNVLKTLQDREFETFKKVKVDLQQILDNLFPQ